MVGRISRDGQRKTIKVYIIADPSFDGDGMAFEIKAKRMAETKLLSIPFEKKKGDFRAWDHYEALLADKNY